MCDPQLSALVAECLSSAARDICALFGRTVAQYEHKVALLQRTIAEHERLRGPSEPLSSWTYGVQVKVEDPEETKLMKEEPPVTELLRLKTEDNNQDQHRDGHLDQSSAETPKETFAEEPLVTEPLRLKTEDDHQDQPRHQHRDWDLDQSSEAQSSTPTSAETLADAEGPVTVMCGSGGVRRPTKRHHCPECQKGFVRPSDLERHMSVHSGLRPHSCSVCGRNFSQKIHLKRHMKTHSEEPVVPPERKHACTRCGKRFTRNSELNRHLRSHTGLRPFSCSVCTKSFTLRSHLKQHLGTHTSNRAFSCGFCGRSFTQNINLQRHLRVHAREQLEQLGEEQLQELMDSSEVLEYTL